MRPLLYCLGLLFISISSYGQQLKVRDTITKKTKKEIIKPNLTTNIYTLNLSTPTINSVYSSQKTKRLTIQSRDLLQVKLIGGNPFRYKYVINNRFINFFEDQFDNPLQSIDKVLQKETPKPANSAEDTEKEKENSVKDLENTKSTIQIKNKVTDTEKKVFEKFQITYRNKSDAIAKIDTKIDSIKNKQYVPFAVNSLEYLRLNDSYKTPSNLEEDKNAVIDAILKLKDNSESFVNELNSYKRAVNSASELNVGIFKKDRLIYKKRADTLARTYGKIKIDFKKFDKIGDAYTRVETELKSDFTQILNDLNFFYSIKLDNYLLPIDIHGKNIDVVEISLERFEHNSPIAVDKNVYNIWVKGGFKIDISGGIFLTSLVNKEYITEDRTVIIDNQEEQRQVIRQREKGNFEFGFGTAINISHRSASWINPTLNVGALFTVNQQFQLLTGLGAILGKEERIIFSGGLSMGRVSRISEAYEADGTTEYDLGTAGVVPTSNRFDFGYYFGVTYNFSKNKKAK